jgi:hypothetical protein
MIIGLGLLGLGTGTAQAAERYAAPSGAGTACTEATPCSLATALSDAAANDAVLLAGGTYSGVFASGLTGITVRAQNAASPPDTPGDTPQINGAVRLTGAGSRLLDLRITGSGDPIARAVTIERVVARDVGPGAGVACRPIPLPANGTILDSVCASENGIGVYASAGSGTSNLTLRNVTAVGATRGIEAIAAFVAQPTTIALTARNVIADATLPSAPAIRLERNIFVDQTPTNVSLDIGNSRYDEVATVEVEGPNPDPGDVTVTDSGGNLVGSAPVFRGPGDFRVPAGASTIDAGSATGVSTADVRGIPRTIGSAPDMGAYESVPAPAAPTLTAPADGAASRSPLAVSFTLPQEAAFSSPSLTLTPVGGGTPRSVVFSDTTAGSRTVSVDLADPGSSPGVLFAQGGPITDGAYTAVLAYSEPLELQAVSSPAIDVVIDTVTLAPQLTAPSAGAGLSGAALLVGYTLPEAAEPGSVELELAPAGGGAPRTLTLANAAAGAAAISIDRTAPGASPGVLAESGSGPLADGTYTVTLRYRDALGNDPQATSAAGVTLSSPVTPPSGGGGGGTPPTPPPPTGPVTGPDRTAPLISAGRITPARFPARRPGRAAFRLSEAATVRFQVERRSGKRWRKLGRPATRRAPAGKATIRLPRNLPPARYRLVLTATDAAGNRSAPVRLTFRVRF